MTRYFGLGKETVAYGTIAAATRYMAARASIKPDRNYQIPDPVITREFRKNVAGYLRSRGNVEFNVEPENCIGEMLYGVFGSCGSVNEGGGVYQHTFTGAETLPSYTIYLGVEQTERILKGGLVESLTIKMSQGQIIKATAEVLSGFAETKATIKTPAEVAAFYSALSPLSMIGGYVSIGGIDKGTVLFDAEVTIKNNIPFSRGTLVEQTFAKKRYGKRSVTGTVSLYFDDTSEYDRFIAGTEFILVLTDNPTPASVKFSLQLRKCKYLRNSVPDVIPQDEPIVLDAPFQAFYDTTDAFNSECKATLRNAISGY